MQRAYDPYIRILRRLLARGVAMGAGAPGTSPGVVGRRGDLKRSVPAPGRRRRRAALRPPTTEAEPCDPGAVDETGKHSAPRWRPPPRRTRDTQLQVMPSLSLSATRLQRSRPSPAPPPCARSAAPAARAVHCAPLHFLRLVERGAHAIAVGPRVVALLPVVQSRAPPPAVLRFAEHLADRPLGRAAAAAARAAAFSGERRRRAPRARAAAASSPGGGAQRGGRGRRRAAAAARPDPLATVDTDLVRSQPLLRRSWRATRPRPSARSTHGRRHRHRVRVGVRRLPRVHAIVKRDDRRVVVAKHGHAVSSSSVRSSIQGSL